MRLAETAAKLAPDAPVVPQLPPSVPLRGSTVGRIVGRVGFRLFGWKVAGNLPNIDKGVIIVAPHTSNWDFIAGFWAYLALDLHTSWFGKHTLFWGPFGPLFRHFGGIPIRRDSREASQVVDDYAEAFASRERMLLAIAPEGTRKRVAEWKSGFYRIALRAGVPIVPVGLDFRLSLVILGEPFYPTGDWDRDIVSIKSLYEGVSAKNPHQF